MPHSILNPRNVCCWHISCTPEDVPHRVRRTAWRLPQARSAKMSHNMARDGAWGAAARNWAEVQEPLLRPLFATVLERTRVGPGSVVCDVACGTGLCCALAAGRGATVAGLDASAGQLAIARERTPAGDFREGDMEALPFAPAAF